MIFNIFFFRTATNWKLARFKRSHERSGWRLFRRRVQRWHWCLWICSLWGYEICPEKTGWYQVQITWGECGNCKNYVKSINVTEHSTVWNCHDFSITQISREINFGNSWSAKAAILTSLEALNFDLYGFLHFLKAEYYQMDHFQSPKICKNGSFWTSRFSKIDFT